jgi:type IV pilus assembly protein PilV
MSILSYKKIKHSEGFSLIEVLITMLIMAVGLMGIAALQFRGLQYSHDAYIRTQINFLAYDIADRMRLNRANATGYDADYVIPTTLAAVGTCTQATAQSAANDLICWRQLVYGAIPPGSLANIDEDPDGSGTYEITLSWTDRGNLAHAITYTFQP